MNFQPRVVNNPPKSQQAEESPLEAVASAQRLAAARVAESALKASLSDCVFQLFCTVGVASNANFGDSAVQKYI
jgi:hypothetical protein